MALQQYSRATIKVGGDDVLEEVSFTLNRVTNSQPVVTKRMGYNGETPGAPQVDLTVESAVLSTMAIIAGYEPGNFMLALSPVGSEVGQEGVNFVIQLDGGKAFQFEGFIISDSLTSGVNANSALSFSARGRLSSTWE